MPTTVKKVEANRTVQTKKQILALDGLAKR